jgi:ribosomal protein S1
MRTIDEDGIQVEVVKVEEAKIPKSEFSLSSGFKEVTFGEIIRLAMIGSTGSESEEDSDN